MGVKVCIELGCWQATPNTRCPEHERVWQARRNKRRGRDRTPAAAYRQVSLAGQVCACCGTTEDLTRHHVSPLARRLQDRYPATVGLMSGAEWGGIIPMCRRCNSSIGVRVMAGTKCPMHGGQVADGAGR